MAWATGKYRVRRLGPGRFHIVNPRGEYVENEKGNLRHFGSHKSAVKAVKEYQLGNEKEVHPLLDDY